MQSFFRAFMSGALLMGLAACDDNPFNNPYQDPTNSKTRYTAFFEPLITLDPAKAYTTSAHVITAQIYEPPLQYHYLKRPFQLQPLTLKAVPVPKYYNQAGRLLSKEEVPSQVAYTVYDLVIKPGIRYAPHPAFVHDASGALKYHQLSARDLAGVKTLHDFPLSASRELVAQDYAYGIKRLASPVVSSPIYGVMAEHIKGLVQLRQQLLDYQSRQKKAVFDLRDFNLSGVEVVDDHHLRITIKGVYPQFLYWLAMPFFAPIPWEVDDFYNQKGMSKRNLTLDTIPVGTGPYVLTRNNPSRRMVLHKNPLFHEEFFPKDGEPSDQGKPYMQLQGKRMPFIDELLISLEKESIPRWVKFLQGYYDAAILTGDSFEQSITLDSHGQPALSEQMKAKGMHLLQTVEPSIFYLGFNWLDPVVGGNSRRARKLRHAIAIAVNFDEYIQIFLNGRGRRGVGPIPPGIFGYQAHGPGVNHVIFKEEHGHLKRRELSEAKQLLVEAGYPEGVDPKTGRPLRLGFDVAAVGPAMSSYLSWVRKQFSLLGLDLQIRNTRYNRFQKKMLEGSQQIFFGGWMGDYPDPENFLFLFDSRNGKKLYGGENASNYHSATFDRLFDQVKQLEDGPRRAKLIEKMLILLAEDMPVVVGYYPVSFTLLHRWNIPGKPVAISGNFLKYLDLNPQLRLTSQKAWNKPSIALLWSFLLGFIGIGLAVFWVVRRRSKRPLVRRFQEDR